MIFIFTDLSSLIYDYRYRVPFNGLQCIGVSSVADSYHFDTDPDHFDTDPYPGSEKIRYGSGFATLGLRAIKYSPLLTVL